MDIQQAYDSWSEQYDTNKNKTRDFEAKALKKTVGSISFNNCLEIGCGTGKNTEWLAKQAKRITAVDFSRKMLTIAKQKIKTEKVQFQQADITQKWDFTDNLFELITFSLVLEHVEKIEPVFQQLSKKIVAGGYVYIGELYPFKQYMGTKAKFETPNEQQVLTCFDHHISDFTQPALQHGFNIIHLNEFFDENERSTVPRILTLLLKKK